MTKGHAGDYGDGCRECHRAENTSLDTGVTGRWRYGFARIVSDFFYWQSWGFYTGNGAVVELETGG